MKKSLFLVGILVLLSLVSCKTIFHSDFFTISLEENPTTGYRWEFYTDDLVIQLVDDEYEPKAKANIVGAGGIRTFTFELLEKADAEIKLYYRRNWEPFPSYPDVIYIYNSSTDTLEELI